MREILENRLKKRQAKKDELEKKALASNDVAEVRAIYNQIADLNEEIAEVREEIAAIDTEERAAQTPPAGAQLVNGNVTASFRQNANTAEHRDDVHPTDRIEYRRAFQAYVQHGTPIPAELRAGDAITTADMGAAIPLTIMNEVINTVRKRYGNLYSKVKKTSVRGGVEIPVGSLKATFKWVNQSTVSPRQKAGNLGKVQFAYHTAEIRVAQSFVAYITALDAFEAELARVIAIAYLQAMDEAIINGTGDGMPLGILHDPRVTHVVNMTAADINDWTKWRKNFFAALPLGYRSGEFIFPASTVDAYLETMADNNNNPIFRQATGLEVNDGDAVNPNGRFFGRDIALVEPDIVADFDSASNGDVIGVFWQPEEYAINENFGFTMRRYFDEETNEYVDKALTVVDGKILNPEGYWLIKKKV